MDNRSSFPLVYTMNGTYVGALFHGQCDKCNTKYFTNYKIQSAGQRIFIDVQQEGSGYFQVLSDCVRNISFERHLKQHLGDWSNLTISRKSLQFEF